MSTTKDTYSLGEAVLLTGFSRNKFHYNKEVLIEDYGVVITATGWTIPHSALERLGWLGVKEPKTRNSVTVKQYETAQAEIVRLTAEVERLNAELNSKRWSLFRKR